MSESPASAKGPPLRTPMRRSRIWATVKALTRTRVMAGLIVVLPIYVTVVVVRFVFELMRDSSQWVVYGLLEGHWISLLPESWGVTWNGFPSEELQGPRIQWGIALFSVILTVIILYMIGLLTANIVGTRILTFFERLVDRVPLVKTAYRLPQQILATFAARGDDAPGKYERVVLVPFPSADVRSVGFVTGTRVDRITGEELCTVFIACTPPTTGFVFLLKRSALMELDWSMEDAFQAVMSAGILMPREVSLSAPMGAKPSPVGAPR